MKKMSVILTCMLLSFSAHAVNDQINQAESLLNQGFTDTVTKDSDIILETGVDIDLGKAAVALAPKREIKYGQSHPLLKDYQLQHGLTPNGKFDDETLAFVQHAQQSYGFNVTKTLDYQTWFATFQQPAIWKEDVTLKSIEEWEKVLSKQSFNNTNKFVVVNIPTMTLHAYEYDTYNMTATEVFTSRVVVGKRTNQTPLDDMYIWGVKYHPTWTPTPNMLKRNVYKNGQINTAWLSSHNVKAINSEGRTVPYSEITRGQNLRFVQPAGNGNALGILKFETTSTENIYLHDTNEKRLFGHNTRAYSSGCVRVQEYQELSMWINNMDNDTFDKKIKNGNTRIEKIQDQVPVYYTYSQLIFSDGQAIFAPDIYGKNNNTDFK